jgi:hypothetical protein
MTMARRDSSSSSASSSFASTAVSAGCLRPLRPMFRPGERPNHPGGRARDARAEQVAELARQTGSLTQDGAGVRVQRLLMALIPVAATLSAADAGIKPELFHKCTPCPPPSARPAPRACPLGGLRPCARAGRGLRFKQQRMSFTQRLSSKENKLLCILRSKLAATCMGGPGELRKAFLMLDPTHSGRVNHKQMVQALALQGIGMSPADSEVCAVRPFRGGDGAGRRHPRWAARAPAPRRRARLGGVGARTAERGGALHRLPQFLVLGVERRVLATGAVRDTGRGRACGDGLQRIRGTHDAPGHAGGRPPRPARARVSLPGRAGPGGLVRCVSR